MTEAGPSVVRYCPDQHQHWYPEEPEEVCRDPGPVTSRQKGRLFSANCELHRQSPSESVYLNRVAPEKGCEQHWDPSMRGHNKQSVPELTWAPLCARRLTTNSVINVPPLCYLVCCVVCLESCSGCMWGAKPSTWWSVLSLESWNCFLITLISSMTQCHWQCGQTWLVCAFWACSQHVLTSTLTHSCLHSFTCAASCYDCLDGPGSLWSRLPEGDQILTIPELLTLTRQWDTLHKIYRACNMLNFGNQSSILSFVTIPPPVFISDQGGHRVSPRGYFSVFRSTWLHPTHYT